MKKNFLLLVALFAGAITLFAQPIYNKDGIRLYHTPSQEEIEWAKANNIKAVTVRTAPPSGELRPIAEYEPAEAVLVRYPFGIPISLIKEIAKDTKVITIVANTSEKTTVQNQYSSNGVNPDNCQQFLIATTDSYWTRDYGPWFMAINNHDVGIFDFNYDRPRPNDNLINGKLATFLTNDGTKPINVYASTLQLTGGNYMNDGVSQAAATTLTLEDNSGYTAQQIKDLLLQYLGIEQYNIITDPLQEYIEHIDCWGKYLAPDKVMIGQVATSDPRYALFEATANAFASMTSPYGTPMQVFRVYSPGNGSTYTSTPYTNSLILNKKVFVPITGNANDAAALQAYQNAMPGYQIIGINYNSWEITDALHCRTHEIADRCMLYIKHQPLFGEIENTGCLTFDTELYSYCDNTIYSDSVFVYVSTDGGESYSRYNMTNIGGHAWEATVSVLPSGLIEYYIFAADQSGRREFHPYIGAPDPHKFTLIGEPPLLPTISLDKTNSSAIYDGLDIVEDQITISNTGEADLTFDIADIDFPDMLTITPLNGTVQPGNSSVITLSYDFSQAVSGEYLGSFKLLTNDCANPEIEISLSVTKNTDGINETNISPIQIYPNPANDKINIVFDGNNFTKANIYNVLGVQLKEITLTKGINTIDLEEFPNSIYLIKIGQTAYKFVKQ